MVYILNSLLKDNKKSSQSLCGCFGLGLRLGQQICDQLGIGKNVKLAQLTGAQKSRLIECVSQNYQIGVSLKSHIKKQKARLVGISCYRGFRSIRKLPCRGQRTHTNSRTCRRQN